MRRTTFVVIALAISVCSGFASFVYDSRGIVADTPLPQNIPELAGVPANEEVLGSATEPTPVPDALSAPKVRRHTVSGNEKTAPVVTAKKHGPAAEQQVEQCNPNYVPCVPLLVGAVTCENIGFAVTVKGDDVYGIDPDKDLSACEEYAHNTDEDTSIIPLPNPVSERQLEVTGMPDIGICEVETITCASVSMLLSTL